VRIHGFVATAIKHLHAIAIAAQYAKDLIAYDVPVMIHDVIFIF
jgi:hypothetical protein